MIAAQVADLVTYLAMGPEYELNPVVVALGPWAVVAKLMLIGFLVFSLPFVGIARPRLERCVRSFAIVAGLLGATSNIVTIAAS